MNEKLSEIVTFEDGELKLEVGLDTTSNTVWLTQKQMEELFSVKHNTISEHIQNIFKDGELLECNSVGISDRSRYGRKPKIYNLDVIISVGYRVKSQRGIAFRKWATSILKEYMIKGYVVNQKRMEALNQTVILQSNIIAGMAGIDAANVLTVVEEYVNALSLLDDYDHQCLHRPKGRPCVYELKYQECRDFIDQMSFDSAVFGLEKEPGKVEGILATIYQEVFGQALYATLEEKAARSRIILLRMAVSVFLPHCF